MDDITLAPTSRPPPPPALIPPFRYAIVEDGVARGAHPTLKNYRFLRRLRLRTMISLMAEPPTRDLSEFCGAEAIDLIYHRVEKYDDAEVLSISSAVVTEVLSVLLNPALYPVFIHCRDGGHNTGLVIMCLRKLQHWTSEVVYEEHRRYTKLNEIHYQERQFTEAFSGPVTLSRKIPPWLWGGTRIRAHPSIRLNDPAPQPEQKNERELQSEAQRHPASRFSQLRLPRGHPVEPLQNTWESHPSEPLVGTDLRLEERTSKGPLVSNVSSVAASGASLAGEPTSGFAGNSTGTSATAMYDVLSNQDESIDTAPRGAHMANSRNVGTPGHRSRSFELEYLDLAPKGEIRRGFRGATKREPEK